MDPPGLETAPPSALLGWYDSVMSAYIGFVNGARKPDDIVLTRRGRDRYLIVTMFQGCAATYVQHQLPFQAMLAALLSKISEMRQVGPPGRHQLPDDECPICLESYGPREYFRRLRCGHCFHRKCVDRYFRTRAVAACPYCREDFLGAELREACHVPSDAEARALQTAVPVAQVYLNMCHPGGSGGDVDEPEAQREREQHQPHVQDAVGGEEHVE